MLTAAVYTLTGIKSSTEIMRLYLYVRLQADVHFWYLPYIVVTVAYRTGKLVNPFQFGPITLKESARQDFGIFRSTTKTLHIDNRKDTCFLSLLTSRSVLYHTLLQLFSFSDVICELRYRTHVN